MNIQEFLLNAAMNPQGMQPTPGPAPQMPQEDVPRGTFDPLGKGASEAIQSVRQSIGAKKPSMARPFVQMLGDAGGAIMRGSQHPIVQEMGKTPFDPYAQQDAEIAENMKIMQFLQEAEKARQHQLLQKQQLEEMSRHHRASEGLHGQALGMKYKNEMPVSINGESVDFSGYSPIQGKSELNRLQKAKTLYGNVLHKLDTSMTQLNDLDTLTAKDTFKPTDPVMGSVSQMYTNSRASMGNPKAIKERNSTKLLNDTLTRLRVTLEQADKGGIPGEQMMKRFEEKGILPHLHDSSTTIKSKLEAIKKEISEKREAADLSLKTGRNIDVHDLEYIRGRNDPSIAETGISSMGEAPDKMSTESIMQEINALKGAG